MRTIKLHLEDAEYDAVERFAGRLKLKPEAVTYGALNRLMLDSRSLAVQADIVQTWAAHRDNLPLWSDSAQSIHAYEGSGSDEPEPSRYFE